MIGPVTRPEAIIAGRYIADGVWPVEISSGHFGGSPVAVTHVPPVVVVEVSADAAAQGGRHRHGVQLIRVRDDLTPDDIAID